MKNFIFTLFTLISMHCHKQRIFQNECAYQKEALRKEHIRVEQNENIMKINMRNSFYIICICFCIVVCVTSTKTWCEKEREDETNVRMMLYLLAEKTLER